MSTAAKPLHAAAWLLGVALAAGAASAGDGVLEPAPSAGCGGEGLAAGVHHRVLMHDGLQRTYQIWVPTVYDGSAPAPLLLNLHPFVLGGPAHGVFTLSSQQTAKAEETGFIVVEPDGTANPPDEPFSWNGGDACCNPPSRRHIDDVDFVLTAVRTVFDELCIDRRRVYASGMSNGAYLSHRIACERPEEIAAIAPISGSFSSELVCADGRAVPVIQISGENDNLASRQASVDRWVDWLGCDEEPTSVRDGDTVCSTHTGCDDGVEVVHCVVDEGNHCFFSQQEIPIVECPQREGQPRSQDLAWDFLSRYALPTPLPEPGATALGAAAVLAIAVARRRRAAP